MRFYNREKELQKLREIRNASFDDHSRLTVVTGRRRVGKTSLVTHENGGEPLVYFFVGRKNESALCLGFCREIATKLAIHVPDMIKFEDVFSFLLELGKTRKFTLVVDEFQEFYNINPSIYSDIQNHWDAMRLESHVNFIVSGSIYSLMTKIFKNNKEPLFGRADATIKVTAFSIPTIKEILHDHNPLYTNDDLLAFYMVTGGVAKYAELLIDNKATTVDKIIRTVCDPDLPFRDEGRNILIEEFGRKYGTYFSILDAVSSGKNTQSEIEAYLGEKSIGGQLSRLENTYEVIEKVRPILSKPGSQTVRYRIKDRFLEFWFRYFENNRPLIEMSLDNAIRKIISADYTTYSGKVLEAYFKQKMRETGDFREIGSYWEAKTGKEAREVDIVAISLDKKHVTIAEVKRQRKEFQAEVFKNKVEHLSNKFFYKKEISTVCLTLDDM